MKRGESAPRRRGRRLHCRALLLLTVATLGASAAAAQTPARRASFSLARGAVAQRALKVPAGGRFRLVGVPLEARTAALDLERFEVFTPDAWVLVQGAQGKRFVRPPSRAYFRGRVEGEPDSLAFLSVGENDEVRGLIVSDGREHVLGAERESAPPEEALIVRAVQETLAKRNAPSWSCDADALPGSSLVGDDGLQATFGESIQGASKASAQYSMVLAIETDYEFYALFNSVDAAAAYVGDLFGAMSAIYYRDVGTTLRVNFVSLWTGGAASDPWTANTPLGVLCEFGTWWHTNRPKASYPRGTAHLLSGKNLGGGVAWIDAVCSNDFEAIPFCAAGQYGGGYGITGNISGGFNPASPTVVWDLYATSHEIGHNFGSPHTHCYNNIPSAGAAQPVDQCRDSTLSNPDETFNGALCYVGPQSLPAGGKGSIMSYCHLLPGGYSNIALSFGAPGIYGTGSERVPQRMQDFVASRPLSCRKPIDAPPADFNGDGRSEVFIYRNGSWVEFPFWPGE